MKRIDNCIEHTNFQTKEAKVRANKKQRENHQEMKLVCSMQLSMSFIVYIISCFFIFVKTFFIFHLKSNPKKFISI